MESKVEFVDFNERMKVISTFRQLGFGDTIVALGYSSLGRGFNSIADIMQQDLYNLKNGDITITCMINHLTF